MERTVIRRDVRRECGERLLEGTTDIVLDVLKTIPMPGAHLPTVEIFRRAGFRARPRGAPKTPPTDNPNFELDLDWLCTNCQEFFRGEVWVDVGGVRLRNLFFVTTVQLKHLGMCVRISMDATFKLVEKPFNQLFTLNGFLKNQKGIYKFVNKKNLLILFFYFIGNIWQVPLAFALMPRQRAEDYAAVLREIMGFTHAPSVKEAVTDFEAAARKAVRTVFPSVRHFG